MKHRGPRPRFSATILAGLLLGIGTAPGLSARAPQSSALPEGLRSQPAHRVVRVVDGDTIVVVIEGRETTIRLIGVDTPETVHPQKAVEAYGKEASRFTQNLLQGESVWLEYEAGVPAKDRYGRTLAYVYRSPDGLFVNLEIIRQGYGHVYTAQPFRYLEQFRAAEKAAREAGKGLWGSAPAALPEAPVRHTLEQKRPQASEQQEVTVYITRTGSRYHRAGCQYLRRSMIPMPLKGAREHYLPCSRCNPPQ